MTKKEYLVKLLEIVQKDTLPIASSLLYLIQNNKASDELIDVVYNIFHEYALIIKEKNKKKQLEKSLQVLKKIKTIEEKDNEKNKKDTKELENMLQNI